MKYYKINNHFNGLIKLRNLDFENMIQFWSYVVINCLVKVGKYGLSL